MAARDPSDGYWSAAAGLLPVVMYLMAGTCDGMVWLSDRTTVSRSPTFASFGSSSENSMPGAVVGIDLNSPRMPSGALGLLSHRSMVAGPPGSHTRITLLALTFEDDRPAAAFASAARRFGSVRPSRPAEPICRKSRLIPSQYLGAVIGMILGGRGRERCPRVSGSE